MADDCDLVHEELQSHGYRKKTVLVFPQVFRTLFRAFCGNLYLMSNHLLDFKVKNLVFV